MNETAKTMTLEEVAQHIGVSRKTLYRMLDDGRFCVEPIAKTKPRRWSTEAVNIWIDNQ